MSICSNDDDIGSAGNCTQHMFRQVIRLEVDMLQQSWRLCMFQQSLLQVDGGGVEGAFPELFLALS